MRLTSLCLSPPPVGASIFCMLLLGSTALAAQAQTGLLNDSAVNWSANNTVNAATCNPAHSERQDCYEGRDPAAAAANLVKIGAGSYGFDFTKISGSGTPLPDTTALGAGPADWACTRDNVTGLIWEVKTTSGLRGKDHLYSWYDSSNPAGHPGTPNGGTCADAGRCDTEKYAEDVNAIGLCGATNWRLPTTQELLGLRDFGGREPAIDLDYFPNTPAQDFWTGMPGAFQTDWAWSVPFRIHTNAVQQGERRDRYSVRLVRAAP